MVPGMWWSLLLVLVCRALFIHFPVHTWYLISGTRYRTVPVIGPTMVDYGPYGQCYRRLLVLVRRIPITSGGITNQYWQYHQYHQYQIHKKHGVSALSGANLVRVLFGPRGQRNLQNCDRILRISQNLQNGWNAIEYYRICGI